MFYGNINDIKKFKNLYPARILEALNYLHDNDFSKKNTGRYEIDGDKMFAIVVDLTTVAFANQKPESHKKYIDVQYIVQGSTIMGVTRDAGVHPIVESLDDKDCYYYDKVDNELQLVMSKGDFAVFFPFDIHRPDCQYDQNADAIRKVVVKVAIDSL